MTRAQMIAVATAVVVALVVAVGFVVGRTPDDGTGEVTSAGRDRPSDSAPASTPPAGGASRTPVPSNVAPAGEAADGGVAGESRAAGEPREAPDGSTAPSAGTGADPGLRDDEGDRGGEPAGGGAPPATVPPPTAVPPPSLPPIDPGDPGREVTAYAWADRPGADAYRPHPEYVHNSAGGGVRVTRAGTGAYTVVFEDAFVRGGAAHAVAYGSLTTAICTVRSWGSPLPIGPSDDLAVNVRCFGPDGGPVDTRFVVNFTSTVTGNLEGERRFGYFWADDPTPDGERTLTHAYQYDSEGGPISYRRLSEGRYAFDTPRIPPEEREGAEPIFPMAHVTAYHDDPVHCQLSPQAGSRVRCVDHDGAPTDTRFVVTYGKGVDMLGQTPDRFGSGELEEPTISGDRLRGHYYGQPAGLGIARGSYQSTGSYEMEFPGARSWSGHAFVNAVGGYTTWGGYGWPVGHCVVGSWAPDGAVEKVEVRCYDFDGDRANLNVRVSFTAYPGS